MIIAEHTTLTQIPNGRGNELQDNTYNGWKNWETWTCALFATNDEEIYELARRSTSWTHFTRKLSYLGITHNQDGVHLRHKSLSFRELTEMIRECR